MLIIFARIGPQTKKKPKVVGQPVVHLHYFNFQKSGGLRCYSFYGLGGVEPELKKSAVRCVNQMKNSSSIYTKINSMLEMEILINIHLITYSH